jgi:glycosyltransferase involved in cell wall biosynthesis
MNMAKCLIILTSRYPYSFEEPFLESEITYHSRNFERVIVFPLDINQNDKPTRLLPSRVECVNSAKGRRVTARLGDVLSGALRSLRITKEYKEDKSRIGFSVPKRVFLEFFQSRSLRHFKQIDSYISNIDFSQFDEIVLYSYWLFVTAQVALLLRESLEKRGINVRLISRAHRYDLYEYANKLNYLPLRKELVSAFDAIYPCSADGEEYLRKAFPEHSEKIRVSYLGTSDMGTGSYDNTFRIVSCSRAVPVKRIDRIVDSLALLKGCTYEIEWTHIGGGEELEAIRAKAAEKLSFIKTHFLGSVSNSEVLEYYKNNSVSLFVNTSASEGLPVSIMEAISFGIPVVATDVGGTKEIVLENVSGSLIDKDFTDDELAEKIKGFAQMSTVNYESFRKSTRLFWEENFSAANNYALFSESLAKDTIKQRKNIDARV